MSLLDLSNVLTMVTSDNGLPDPDHPDDELVPPEDAFILANGEDDDADSDQDTVIMDQYYQPLATEENPESNDDESSEDEIQGDDPTVVPSSSSDDPTVPPIVPMERTLMEEIWSAIPKDTIEMDSDKVDEVKQAMLNVTLPTSSIPEWAANVPEEEWKQQLLRRLEKMNEGRS